MVFPEGQTNKKSSDCTQEVHGHIIKHDEADGKVQNLKAKMKKSGCWGTYEASGFRQKLQSRMSTV